MPAPRFQPYIRLIYCVLGLFAAGMAMGLMLWLGSVLATAWTGKSPNEQVADVIARYYLHLTLLIYPACLLWIAYCRTSFDRRSFASLGLRARRVVPNVLRGCVAGALAIGVLWSVLWLTGVIFVAGMSPAAFEMSWSHIAITLGGYALVFVAVACFEEILFRGYILHNLNTWLGWRGAVMAQAIVFAVIHLGNVIGTPRETQLAAVGALPALALIAIFFALCYRKTGSLWFPIGFHFAWNFFLGCVFSLPVSGTETFRLLDVQVNQTSWLSGGAFGAEGSLLLLPILGLMIYFISQAPDHPQAILDLGLLSRTDIAPAPVMPEIEEDEEEEESNHESRFRTKFGSAQGFSADTLRELRELQEQREAAAREARAAAQREADALTSLAVGAKAATEAPVAAPVIAAAPVRSKTVEELVAAAAPEVEEVRPVVAAPAPVVAPAPTPKVDTQPPAPSPAPAPTPEKKKPSPRW